MRMTRHDYDVLKRLSAERGVPYSQFSRSSRHKLEDFGYISHDGSGWYNITPLGRQALETVRGAAPGRPFSKGNTFVLSGDLATVAWLKAAHDSGAIKISRLGAGKWKVQAC